MGNTQHHKQQDEDATTSSCCQKFPHLVEANRLFSSMVTLVDDEPQYRYDFFDRNKQLLEFHILRQTNSLLIMHLGDCKRIYQTIFSYMAVRDLLSLSLTCRLMFLYWTKDDEIWRNVIPSSTKTELLSIQPFDFSIFGIRSWRDCCKHFYCKELWKRLESQYEFVDGSMCSNNSDDESSRTSNRLSQTFPRTANDLEEFRVHFICDEKKQRMARYLQTILKHCKEPFQEDSSNKRASRRFLDRRVTRVRELRCDRSPITFEIQCLVGTNSRPNCSCKIACIDLSETMYDNYLSQTDFKNDRELVEEFCKKDLDCGEVLREYLQQLTNAANSDTVKPGSMVICGLSYSKKNEINPKMKLVAKAISRCYKLPYIEIDVGSSSRRRDLLFYYSAFCHSNRVTPSQLAFLSTNNLEDEWK
ncbi:hypothetical protein C9374_000629 [Naegleria lovaniensis]|uniref:F-box domain-containing protein n=1 Tax=Naegleria lovaniensis TaxID=51637 RepID=A0AA88KM09_NAELO|nr:uncharacterized protein C9374_000629 [Naegleria lovaniensis]KAG2388465.1 hypothetical protein C9374_000629 [Naegleria lovaniensis]